MVHEDHPNIAQLTWAHDPRAVTLARKKYEIDREGCFGMYMSTLYSFRDRPECVEELAHNWRRIAHRLRNLMSNPGQPNVEKWANRVDTFSTHLEWLSHQPALIKEERDETLLVAKQAVLLGLELTTGEELGGHNCALLQLTCANILIGERDLRTARQYLRNAYDRAHDITDPEQRPRVYRKIARLAFSAHDYPLVLRAGIWWFRTKKR